MKNTEAQESVIQTYEGLYLWEDPFVSIWNMVLANARE